MQCRLGLDAIRDIHVLCPMNRSVLTGIGPDAGEVTITVEAR